MKPPPWHDILSPKFLICYIVSNSFNKPLLYALSFQSTVEISQASFLQNENCFLLCLGLLSLSKCCIKNPPNFAFEEVLVALMVRTNCKELD